MIYVTGQFRYPAVKRYVNDLTVEMGDHMENVTEALIVFRDTGVPTIRFTQEHTAHGLQNLSTVVSMSISFQILIIEFRIALGNLFLSSHSIDAAIFVSIQFIPARP